MKSKGKKKQTKAKSKAKVHSFKVRKPAPKSKERFLLRLYITGTTPQSKRALLNVKRICEKYLEGNYELEVVDIYQDTRAAREYQLVAAPTLIKVLPKPLRRLIGDMSNEQRVLLGLDIRLSSTLMDELNQAVEDSK